MASSASCDRLFCPMRTDRISTGRPADGAISIKSCAAVTAVFGPITVQTLLIQVHAFHILNSTLFRLSRPPPIIGMMSENLSIALKAAAVMSQMSSVEAASTTTLVLVPVPYWLTVKLPTATAVAVAPLIVPTAPCPMSPLHVETTRSFDTLVVTVTVGSVSLPLG